VETRKSKEKLEIRNHVKWDSYVPVERTACVSNTHGVLDIAAIAASATDVTNTSNEAGGGGESGLIGAGDTRRKTGDHEARAAVIQAATELLVHDTAESGDGCTHGVMSRVGRGVARLSIALLGILLGSPIALRVALLRILLGSPIGLRVALLLLRILLGSPIGLGVRSLRSLLRSTMRSGLVIGLAVGRGNI
jgi:hypothetical protein